MTNSQHKLFVSSYAAQHTEGIYGMIFDSATGKLTLKSAFSGIENPSFMAIHPNGRWLYTVGEKGAGSGSVHALEIEPDSLELRLLNNQSAKGGSPCHVEIDRSGHWLATTNYSTGNAAVYPITDNGSLGPMSAFVQHEGSGPNKDRQLGPHAHSSIFTPDNKFLIVADLGIDQLVVYKFDDQIGTLAKHLSVAADPGAGPRHLAFHPNHKVLYCANELESSVTVYDYQAATGSLQLVESLSTLPAPDSANSVADIHTSASGEHLFVSNRGHNSVAVYNINTDGRLSALGFTSCGGDWPRNFAMGPTGRFLLVANRHTNDIVSIRLDLQQPDIAHIQHKISVPSPVCIKFL